MSFPTVLQYCRRDRSANDIPHHPRCAQETLAVSQLEDPGNTQSQPVQQQYLHILCLFTYVSYVKRINGNVIKSRKCGVCKFHTAQIFCEKNALLNNKETEQVTADLLFLKDTSCSKLFLDVLLSPSVMVPLLRCLL